MLLSSILCVLAFNFCVQICYAEEALIESIAARTGYWVDLVAIKLRNGTNLEYRNAQEKGDVGGRPIGPENFDDEEILVKVLQKQRPVGLGDNFQFITSCGMKQHQVINFGGAEQQLAGDPDVFEASAGKQIVGLVFQNSKLVGLTEQNYTPGCVTNFPVSKAHDFSDCPARLEVGKRCRVSCATSFKGGVEHFSCPNGPSTCPPKAQGSIPTCEAIETLGHGAVLVAAAALTAAIAGAYGGNVVSSRTIDGSVAAPPSSAMPLKLSMGGVWRDPTDGSVFLIEPSDMAGAPIRNLKMMSRKFLRLLFDMPLVKEEAHLCWHEVHAGPWCMWHSYNESSSLMFHSIGSAESASESWWKGQMLWTAGEGTTLERVSQHRLVMQLPRRRPRILNRRKVGLTRFWSYLFPTAVGVMALCSLLVDRSVLSISTYVLSVVIHFRSYWLGRYECNVPAPVPQTGCVGLLVLIALFKILDGEPATAEVDTITSAVLLVCLFFMSGAGYGCVAGGVSVVTLALSALATLVTILALEVHFFIQLLLHRRSMDLASFSCIAAGLLQLAAAKIWSNQADTRFLAQASIELQGTTTGSEKGRAASAGEAKTVATYSMDDEGEVDERPIEPLQD